MVFLKCVVASFLLLAVHSVSFAQQTPILEPYPEPVVQVDCQLLQQQVGFTHGQIGSWHNTLVQRRNALAARQAHLVTLQGWYSLFMQTVAEQNEPMSPGQEITLMNLLMALTMQQAEIAQYQTLVNQAQAQVNFWMNEYQKAVANFNAAGC